MLDHRRFWDAMHAVTLEQLEEISRAIAVRMVAVFGLDCSSVALDMTNFATYIDTANDKAPIAQRGKAKQKRADLRLVGLGLVVTRDGGIPLVWHAYPGNRPDVTQFPTMIDQLRSQYQAVCAAAGGAGRRRGDDGGLRRRAELRGQLRPPGRDRAALRRVGARQRLPGPARPARHRAHRRRPGPVRRADRATTPAARSTAPSGASCSPTPRTCTTAQARGFDGTTLAKAGKKLAELAATLARGKTRRARDKVDAEIETITRQALGPPRHHLAADRRPAPGPAPDLEHRPGTPAPRWKTRSSANTS